MHFKQFYLGCLAHASYLIADGGEAAVVDPQRDVDQYIDEAAKQGAKIKYIIETHLHADFVSGHRELAARTGAEIVIGAGAGAEFPHRAAHDGDVLRVGGVELRALATPGHTPESMSWLVGDKKVLTGDTLFIGDVGRPDLAGGRGFTPQAMASMMYDSLHSKLLELADDVQVFPAHGAGSACGRNISKERTSTIGVQRQTNYALRPMPREEFVQLITSQMPAAPPYFARDAEINRRGARPLDEVHAARLANIDTASLVLDVRDEQSFGTRHISRAINIGLGGQFASWCGTLLPADASIVIAADSDARADEAVMRLARVGIESATGYVTDDAGQATATLRQITVQHLDGMQVLDVRRAAEYAGGHVPNATNIPLEELSQRMSEVPRGSLAVICGSGYRSSIACSLLMREGRDDVMNVTGGTSAYMKSLN
jgi:hydroxyacylglutathione hydrolase